MKQPEYIEGPKAWQNFKRGMETLFKTPKSAVKDVMKKKQQDKPTASTKEPKSSDKG